MRMFFDSIIGKIAQQVERAVHGPSHLEEVNAYLQEHRATLGEQAIIHACLAAHRDASQELTPNNQQGLVRPGFSSELEYATHITEQVLQTTKGLQQQKNLLLFLRRFLLMYQRGSFVFGKSRNNLRSAILLVKKSLMEKYNLPEEDVDKIL